MDSNEDEYGHVTHFAGLPVADWDAETGIGDPTGTIYRVGMSWDEGEEGKKWIDKFSAFMSDPAVGSIPAIVIGVWAMLHEGGEHDSSVVVEALVAARDRLPNLKAIYLGDIVSEEQEISWIEQSDVSPLFGAYPQLEEFRVRGGNGLSLGSLRHDRLSSLTIESGGLDRRVVGSVAMAHLPALEHLELWLGTEEYGANATLGDLEPILSGRLFPKLRYLGLRDSEIVDAIAVAVANAPITERISVLDLSLGTLTDEGAAALLASPLISRLDKLDLHHHFCSPEMVQRLEGLGIEVDVSEREEPDEYDGEVWRYVAIGE